MELLRVFKLCACFGVFGLLLLWALSLSLGLWGAAVLHREGTRWGRKRPYGSLFQTLISSRAQPGPRIVLFPCGTQEPSSAPSMEGVMCSSLLGPPPYPKAGFSIPREAVMLFVYPPLSRLELTKSICFCESAEKYSAFYKS